MIKTITLISYFLLTISAQAFAVDYTGQVLDGSGVGRVSKNNKGKVVGVKCPRSITNNVEVNLNCGLSKSPGPLLIMKRRGSTFITRYCKGVPCGGLRKAVPRNRIVRREKPVKKAHVTQYFKNTPNKQVKIIPLKISKQYSRKKQFIRENYANKKPKRTAIMLNNKIQDLTLYYPNGVKQYRRIIRGNIVSVTHYYQNRKIRESYQFKTYPEVFYDKNISYKNNGRVKLINSSYEYYPSGRLYREIIWKDNQKVRVRVFDINGRLRR